MDLGSLNKSVLDGVEVPPNTPTVLEDGAEVAVGPFHLSFTRRAVAETPASREDGRAPRDTPPAASAPGIREPGGEPESAPGRDSSGAVSPELSSAADAALAPVMDDLDLQYASYRGTWEQLWSAVERVLSDLPPPVQAAVMGRLTSRYPVLAAEPQLLERWGGPGVMAGRGSAPDTPAKVGLPAGGAGGATAEALSQLRGAYLPVTPGSPAEGELEPFLHRIGTTLEAFGRSFIELQRGYEEFGKDMGVRAVHGEGGLYRAADARQLLAYLLDPRAEGRDRELQRAFTDFMIHQVALFRGVVEGAKAVLARVAPEAISAQLPHRVWPLRAQALWSEYQARFHEVADEESALTESLFGSEFARAYATMVGQSEPARDEESPKPRRGRR